MYYEQSQRHFASLRTGIIYPMHAITWSCNRSLRKPAIAIHSKLTFPQSSLPPLVKQQMSICLVQMVFVGMYDWHLGGRDKMLFCEADHTEQQIVNMKMAFRYHSTGNSFCYLWVDTAYCHIFVFVFVCLTTGEKGDDELTFRFWTQKPKG